MRLFRASSKISSTVGATEPAIVKPMYYKESDLAGNNIYELAKKQTAFKELGFEIVLRALSKNAGSGIVKKHDDSTLNTYTHTESGHSITLNTSGNIVDYFPKS